MKVTLDLVATSTGELLASVPVPGAAFVNRDRRLIGGLSVPWNVAGTPSIGRCIFRAGSVSVPDQQSWVKFLVEHDPLHSIGSLHRSADTEAGLIAALRVADGPDGDRAIDNVENGTRDGLSVRVEVDRWNKVDDSTIEVLASRLREISLVAVPAYEPARASVLASIPTERREAIMSQLRDMLEITASAPGTPGDPGTGDSGQGQPDGGSTNAPQPAPAPAPAPSPAPQPDQGQQVQATLTLDQVMAALAPHLARQGHGGRPGDAPAPLPVAPGRSGPINVQAAASIVARWQNEGSGNVVSLMAALNDVVPANDAGGGSGVGNDVTPQWLGELWQARRTGRPYVDALGTPKPLTGLKAKGWRWVTRPEVDDYAGNKAAIPSNAVATEPAEANAHRTAGGWDVDRVFVDLGDASFVEALFSAAAEDYALKSNSWLGAQLLAAAVAADADGLPATSLLEALGLMAGSAAGIGAQITFLAIAADLFQGFASLTKDEVPWWFTSSAALDLAGQSANAGGFRMWVDPDLDAGTWLAGDRRAATYYEKGTTPIRAQAINIPNGGIDLGVFGYNAVIINDDRALLHGTIA